MSRTLYLGLPCRPGLKADDPIAIRRPTALCNLKVARVCGSLLNLNFNRLWANALNCRDEAGITHFAMCHDDVTPEPGWADTLVAELDRTGADLVSVVLPLKDERGLTSTGLRDSMTGTIRRLTTREVMGLPETFDADDCRRAGITCGPEAGGNETLLVNTGLWVCRFDGDWPRTFGGFRSVDVIRPTAGGAKFEAVTFPEDWCFSEWLRLRGVKVLATRKVPALHHGPDRDYRNDEAWGTCDVDPGDDPKV